MIKYIYINLDRRPDRRKHIETQFKKSDIPMYERFEALDGNDLNKYNITLSEISLFKHSDFKHKSFTKNIIGNQLSHIRAIQTLLDSKYGYAVIMQDDMLFIKNFKEEIDSICDNLPQDAEIINIGFHQHAVYSKVIPFDLTANNTSHIQYKMNDFVCKLKPQVNPCSSCYIITKNGAQNFIDYIFKSGCKKATDHNFNEYLIDKGIFYGSTKVLCTGNDMGSDIFL